MSQGEGIKAFARWVAYGLAHSKKLDVHLDNDDDNIVLHLFVDGVDHNHREILMAKKAFQGLEQVSDFLRSSRQPQDSAMQKKIDIDLGKSILREIGIEGWTNITLAMPIKNPPDMDLYIYKQKNAPKGAWIEFTSSYFGKGLKNHLLTKLGQIYMAKLLKMEKVKENLYDEVKAESVEKERAIEISKFMHVSLYPIGGVEENENFSSFSFFDSSFIKRTKKGKDELKTDQILDFLLENRSNLEEILQRKWEEFINKIKNFLSQ